MSGEGQRRLCDACDKHVHDLASLTASEAERLLASAPPGGLCVRVEHDDDGVIHFKPGGAGVRAVMTLAVGASLLVAGCRPAEDRRATPEPAREHPGAPAGPAAPAAATTEAPRGDLAPRGETPPAENAAPEGKVVAPPPARSSRTIGCACVESDPLCSCL